MTFIEGFIALSFLTGCTTPKTRVCCDSFEMSLYQSLLFDAKIILLISRSNF